MKSDSAENTGLDPTRLPVHAAMIMDGNGRWAQKRMLNRINGHERGADTVRAVVRASREIGIQYLTLYAFSTENWQRPKSEIKALMTLLKRFLASERDEMVQNNVQLRVLGQTRRLPEDVRQGLDRVMDATRGNDGLCLCLALSYGARTEIVEAAQSLARQVKDGRMNPEDITEELFSQNLYTAAIPDPELLIRTSGEYRISNFLLWQIAYSEIFVTPTLWPDFTREEFIGILRDFQRRDRRFGKVSEQ